MHPKDRSKSWSESVIFNLSFAFAFARCEQALSFFTGSIWIFKGSVFIHSFFRILKLDETSDQIPDNWHVDNTQKTTPFTNFFCKDWPIYVHHFVTL